MKKKFGKNLNEQNFLKLSIIMAGIVMIFSSINSIFLSYRFPKVPSRELPSNIISTSLEDKKDEKSC